MRYRRERAPAVPLKYRRFRPDEWPGGPGEWAAEREAWAAAQPPILLAGTDFYGRPWRVVVTPLGDQTALMRARREARMLDAADVDSG